MKLYIPDQDNHMDFKLYGKINNCFGSHFLLDKDKWIFVNNRQDADIIAIHTQEFVPNDFSNLISEHQILMVMLLESSLATAMGNIENISHNKNEHKKTIYISTDAGCNDLQYIFYDIMFNRHKLFYTNYTSDLMNHFWSLEVNKQAFSLAEINKNLISNSKSFLIPNRIRYDQTYFHNDVKIKLDAFIKNNLSQNTYYYGNPFAENGTYLKPNNYVSKIVSDARYSPSDARYSPWVPIGDYYYDTSYVTICIESHCETTKDFDTFFSPSEKYFDPFMKGNFPLIFATPFAIRNLKEYYGFKFPNWIDYSYDTVINFDDRLEAYFNSIKKLSKLSLTELHTLYLQDKHILDHNRSIFFTKSYDSLYGKIEKNLKKLDWL